jgi:hypothetical protein
MAKKTNTPDSWEMKDRIYYLKSDNQPVVYVIPSRHTRRAPLLWFDTSENVQKELRYATNQNSPFVGEQKGVATLGHIAFRNGTLVVPKRKQNLQKLLSLYHPMKGIIYTERDEVAEATNDLDYMEMEIQALLVARELEVDQAEAILRVDQGSKVNNMTSKEIRRDLLLMAKRNPYMFLELAQDDSVELRNIGIKATEAGILKLSPDNRAFQWASNGRKLFTVPLEEHPYSALAAWFKTDEGMEVLTSIQKRLK